MRLISSVKRMQETCLSFKRKGRSIGFVPTMGALHEGHLSLMRRARKENDILAVSIFVNPIQFGPSEDLARYPRPRRKDARLCGQSGVDLLFCPDPRGMYGDDFRSFVEVKGLSDVLCGATRAGHFRGVATVVAKLFNIVQPDRAYFGQKDCQQSVIIRRMARELDFPVEIRIAPTVRERSGLALSSRNAYLSPDGKKAAVALSNALKIAKNLVQSGVRDSRRILRECRGCLDGEKTLCTEYFSIVDRSTLEPLAKVVPGRSLICCACRIGATRLIDNILV